MRIARKGSAFCQGILGNDGRLADDLQRRVNADFAKYRP